MRKEAIAVVLSCMSIAVPLEAAELYHAPDLNLIIVEGAISSGDFDNLKSMRETSGPIEGLYLRSPGGDFMEAIEIGYWVREQHLSTYASSLCDSACGYIWLAGEKRFTNSVISFHMPFYRTSFVTIEIPDEGIAEAAWYLATLDYSKRLLDALLVVSLTESNETFPITGPNTALFGISYDDIPNEGQFKDSLEAIKKAGEAQPN